MSLMENILEIVNLEDYDYSNIKLSNPSIQSGNNYYTNITIGERDKPLYIQFPKCNTKAGCVKNNNKSYTDLIFNSSNTYIIKWLENFEIYLQNEIYKKRDLWFDSEINIDDIQELMTPVMRSYKSGKNILIRCNIKNHKCSIYDENEILLNIDEFTSDKEIIPLICVNGVKFSSKNFTIELNLTQLMILSSKEDLEKNCLIKSRNIKKSNKNNSNTEINSNSLEENTIEENTIEENIIQNNDICKNNIENNNLQEDRMQEDSIQEDIIQEDNIQEDTIQQNAIEKNSINNNTIEEKIIEENIVVEKNLPNNNSLGNNMLLDIVDLDTISVDENDKELNSKINIKNPEEIYYELYKTALIKANTLKKNTIDAFLNAKNIKLKYNLEDLDLDIDLDLDTDLDLNLEHDFNIS